MVDKMKMSSIYSIFGKHYGKKLIDILNECCNGDNSFCNLVRKCLGVSETGNPDLVLNQQGEWVASSMSYNFNDTPSINLTLSGINVTGDVILNPDPSNIISITPTGLLALAPSSLLTYEQLNVVSGNSIALPAAPSSVKVYRNGLRLSSTEYNLSGAVITFVDPFGASGGAIGPEDVIVDYII